MVLASVLLFLLSDVLALLEKPTTLALRRCMEVSKERRVRVEALKKQLAMTLCFNSFGCGFAFSFAAVASTRLRLLRLRLFMEMICFWYSGLAIFYFLTLGQKKAPRLRGWEWVINGKKNGRLAFFFRRGKTKCWTHWTIHFFGKLFGIILIVRSGASIWCNILLAQTVYMNLKLKYMHFYLLWFWRGTVVWY